MKESTSPSQLKTKDLDLAVLTVTGRPRLGGGLWQPAEERWLCNLSRICSLQGAKEEAGGLGRLDESSGKWLRGDGEVSGTEPGTWHRGTADCRPIPADPRTSNLPFVARLDYPNDFFELPMFSEVSRCPLSKTLALKASLRRSKVAQSVDSEPSRGSYQTHHRTEKSPCQWANTTTNGPDC
ncbi:unnamed protein product [Leuciscus chuanchicus]